MRVTVVPGRCQGHTLCAMAAPAVFVPRDEDGHATVAADPIPDELRVQTQAAADGCPEQAIVIEP